MDGTDVYKWQLLMIVYVNVDHFCSRTERHWRDQHMADEFSTDRPIDEVLSWHVKAQSRGKYLLKPLLRSAQTMSDTSQDRARVIEDFKSRNMHFGSLLGGI